MTITRLTRNIFPKIMITLLPFGAAAQSFRITAGCRLILTGPVNLVLNKTNFINDGSFSAGNSTVLFTGSANSSMGTTGNTNTLSFNNLVISKSSGDVTLFQDITVNGSITMNNGNLDLNNRTLIVGSRGSILAEHDQSRITSTNGGRVLTSRAFVPNVANNSGNIGAEVLVTGAQGGVYTIERKHIAENLPGGLQSIQRSFTISGIPAAVNYHLRFFYLTAELNGSDAARLNVWTSASAGGTLSELGRDSNNIVSNWVLKNNINQPAHFTLGNDLSGAVIQPGGNRIKTDLADTDTGTDDAMTAGVKVYPNPVHDNFVIDLFSKEAKLLHIGLYDQSGHLMQQKEIYCAAGMNHLAWDMRHYAAGVYYLHIEGQASKNIQLIKQ